MAESIDLFADNYLDAFNRGEAGALVTERKSGLGNLLNADRAVYYVQILYRLLLFRREHELEPLHEDIYFGVVNAQQALDGHEYSHDQFNTDLNKLGEWELLTCRIEKERLRGYRDSRKGKFRYSLVEETVAFLEWLEGRLQADLEYREDDARDLLIEVAGTLRELLRSLEHVPQGEAEEGVARRVLFQLFKADELSLEVGKNLGRFNARLLMFVLRNYDLDEARQILRELDRYVEKFLRQIHELRREVEPLLDKLCRSACQETLDVCYAALEEERRTAPHLLRRPSERISYRHVPERLRAFYAENGKLDLLYRRINEAAMKVWRKLHAHLRELERRSHRLEDLRARIGEITVLPGDGVPRAFLWQLISPAAMRSDPNHWDEHEKAEPPQPRKDYPGKQVSPQICIPRKKASDAPVRSLEQARLDELRQWLERRLLGNGSRARAKVSVAEFDEFADFERIMQLSRAGYFAGGKKLQQIQVCMRSLEELATVRVESQSLSFRELEVARQP